MGALVGQLDERRVFERVEPIHGFGARSADDAIAVDGRCVIRRLAGQRYLQIELNFPAAEGRLEIYHGDHRIDQADLINGWQKSAVELKDLPTPADLTLLFLDLSKQPLDVVVSVDVRSIGLSESWGMGQRKRLKCYMPFDRANVLQNGDVSMCMCPEWLKAGNVLGNNKTERLKDFWNNEHYQRVRGLFLEGRHEEVCRKEVCIILKGNIVAHATAPEIVESVNEGRTILSHGPTVIQHDVDRGCNLDCVMCRDEKLLPNPENVERGVRDIQDAIDMGSVRQFSTSGAGEVFAMKKIVRMMETEVFSSREISLGFTSNLSYFNDRLWSRIGHNKIDFIAVSADGCSSEVYDKVRLGGDWNVLLKNMRFLSKLKKEGKVGQIIWNYTTLRQNVGDVGRAVELAEELGFDHLRFIAQFGELSRTNGNMFEECDIDALDIFYAELDRVGAFEKPWIWMSEVGMRGRRYRTAEFRLDFAQHVYERPGAPNASLTDLAVYNRRRAMKIVRELVADTRSGKTPKPVDLPVHNRKFLARFSEELPKVRHALREFRQAPSRKAWSALKDAYLLKKGLRQLVGPSLHQTIEQRGFPGGVPAEASGG